MSSDEKTDLYKIFSTALREEIKSFKGEFWEIIMNAPDLFELFVNLAADKEIPMRSRPTISAVVTYFVVPQDILPEEVYGAIGYLDDLFLCAWAVKKLESEIGKEVLERNWKGKKDLTKLVDTILKEIKPRIADVEEDILEFAGLE